nr:MAG TPA: hypothetical protein [Caudoviricetes sp.]
MAQKKKRDKKYRPQPFAKMRNPMLKLVDSIIPVDEDRETQDRLELLLTGEKLVTMEEVVEKDFVKVSCYFRIGARLTGYFEGDLKSYIRTCHETLRKMHKSWVKSGFYSPNDAKAIRDGIRVVDEMRSNCDKSQITFACELAALQLNRINDDFVGEKLRFKANGEIYVD